MGGWERSHTILYKFLHLHKTKEGGDIGLQIIMVLKLYYHALFTGLTLLVLLLKLDWLVQTSSVQTQLTILIYRRGNFVIIIGMYINLSSLVLSPKITALTSCRKIL